MLNLLSDMYMIDLMCDEDLRRYYEKLGMHRYMGFLGTMQNNRGCKGRNTWS